MQLLFHTMTKKDENSFADLISIAEAARLRGVTHAAIQNLIRRDKLPSIEIGGRRFLKRREVAGYQPKPVGRPSKKARKESTKK